MNNTTPSVQIICRDTGTAEQLCQMLSSLPVEPLIGDATDIENLQLLMVCTQSLGELANPGKLPVLLLTPSDFDSTQRAETLDKGVTGFVELPLQPALVNHQLQQQLVLVEQSQMAGKLVRQQLQLKEMGELVGLVAHEVASPLGNVNTGGELFAGIEAETIRKNFDNKTLAAPDLEKFLKQMHRALTMSVKNSGNAGGIISSYRFSIAANQCLQPINQFYLHRYLDDVVLTLKSKLKKLPHEIHIVITESLEMTSYPGAFAVVIMGLINKSLEHGLDPLKPGKIIINASQAVDDEGDDIVVINYIDNGKGFTPETLSNLLSKSCDDPGEGKGVKHCHAQENRGRATAGHHEY